MLPAVESPRWTSLATVRKTYARIPEVHPIPNLIDLQLDSFTWFVEKGLRELFEEISPIQDFTGRVMELHFGEHEFGEPKYTQLECRARDLTFARPLYVDVELRIKETGEIQSQRVFMGDFPFMTDQGTFIINGAERVVVSQLVRSPGVYFTRTEDPSTGRNLFSAKVIPNRGAWLEFETTAKQNVLQLWVKVDRKRKIWRPRSSLRAVGYEHERGHARAVPHDRHQRAGADRRDPGEGRHHDPWRGPASSSTRSCARAIRRPLTTREKLVESLFFNFRRYDLGRVGRYKLNKKLDPVASRMGIELPRDERTITKEDIAAIVGQLIELNDGLGRARRHRPPRQPPRPRRRRADPERSSASACCAWSASSRSA